MDYVGIAVACSQSFSRPAPVYLWSAVPEET